jgi:hypothetical protein
MMRESDISSPSRSVCPPCLLVAAAASSRNSPSLFLSPFYGAQVMTDQDDSSID